ncbi:MAG: hypothetical protein J4G14_09520 [Dehalococcoidia bacterium]|nr:hypothetical protein [Dehalococcoidia bacterium]
MIDFKCSSSKGVLNVRVFLAMPRGFYAGVDRAIEIVKIALARHGAPVYVKHQIVHNPYVVKSLEQMGAVTVEDVRDIPEGANVVFSAHGSPPEDFDAARDKKLSVIDETCPLVTKVHNEALKYTRQGRKIILVGHSGHQELILRYPERYSRGQLRTLQRRVRQGRSSRKQ